MVRKKSKYIFVRHRNATSTSTAGIQEGIQTSATSEPTHETSMGIPLPNSPPVLRPGTPEDLPDTSETCQNLQRLAKEIKGLAITIESTH
ncbi:hypothetical protein TNCV_3453171 [Trichonephila clavipes]|nr:hypothetical protein TNCV_3453171 [Trichonephila clavipes]